MSKIDTDHDGSVSLDEAKKAAIAKFDTLDKDKEGTLDANELTGILGRNDLIKADKDKDKTLDKVEFLALVEKLFAAADKDKDGTLDAKELSTEQGRALVSLLACARCQVPWRPSAPVSLSQMRVAASWPRRRPPAGLRARPTLSRANGTR